IARLAERAGVPTGLINVLAGYGHTIAQAAIAHKAVKKVVFVGSPATGARIAEAAAKRVLPCVLELGGKSANIVFDDADLNRAALTAQAAIFAGAGQSCVAGSRLLVQRSIYDRFVAMVATGAKKIRVGAPTDDATEVGPICHRAQYEHVMKMIASGVESGATLAAGSTERSAHGYFVAPTVLANVHNRMDVARTEI
ncbi:aldehyde dehydrogenase, partial [Burkholderia multivorans]